MRYPHRQGRRVPHGGEDVVGARHKEEGQEAGQGRSRVGRYALGGDGQGGDVAQRPSRGAAREDVQVRGGGGKGGGCGRRRRRGLGLGLRPSTGPPPPGIFRGRGGGEDLPLPLLLRRIYSSLPRSGTAVFRRRRRRRPRRRRRHRAPRAELELAIGRIGPARRDLGLGGHGGGHGGGGHTSPLRRDDVSVVVVSVVVVVIVAVGTHSTASLRRRVGPTPPIRRRPRSVAGRGWRSASSSIFAA